ncbi:unnamed protein product [Heligmosomoides polygyrus]|uniref:AB hydrolase-1 domain-containing protein n=1 Tax=Heligmosomoides polygyrus TaxID=6339 RepID=A0A183G133_HELPZ|nr:unnamed protein product [Heligmosomoides polygyrus]
MVVVVDPPSLLERADLSRPVPENARKLAHLVEVNERRVEVGDHIVFYREALPPDSHYAKAAIVFLHGQSYSSSTWMDRGVHNKPQFLLSFLSALGIKQVIVVTASMAAQYVLPLLAQDVFVCVVGIAPSNTHEIGHPSLYRTPILVLWGDHDTSLGPTAAANLRALPNARLHKIPNAGHACYLNNSQAFEEVCMNFFDLIRNYHAL